MRFERCELCGKRIKYKVNRKYCSECLIKKVKNWSKNYRERNKRKLKKINRDYYLKNKSKILQRCKKYYCKNKEKESLRNKKYRMNNKEKEKIRHQRYYLKNKLKIKDYQGRHYQKNRDKIRKRHKDYSHRNKDEINNRMRKYGKSRRKNNLNYLIRTRIRNHLNYAFEKYILAKKFLTTKKYGVDYKAIIEHLKPIPKNLSNYEIHHIKPLFTFNFVNKDGSTNLEEVKKAFTPKNHQLLTIEEHKKIHHKPLQEIWKTPKSTKR